MQKTNTIQHQKDKQSNLKLSKATEQTLLQGEHTVGPETNEKLFSITSYQRDVN